jgi:hypothetical protein
MHRRSRCRRHVLLVRADRSSDTTTAPPAVARLRTGHVRRRTGCYVVAGHVRHSRRSIPKYWTYRTVRTDITEEEAPRSSYPSYTSASTQYNSRSSLTRTSSTLLLYKTIEQPQNCLGLGVQLLVLTKTWHYHVARALFMGRARASSTRSLVHARRHRNVRRRHASPIRTCGRVVRRRSAWRPGNGAAWHAITISSLRRHMTRPERTDAHCTDNCDVSCVYGRPSSIQGGGGGSSRQEGEACRADRDGCPAHACVRVTNGAATASGHSQQQSFGRSAHHEDFLLGKC